MNDSLPSFEYELKKAMIVYGIGSLVVVFGAKGSYPSKVDNLIHALVPLVVACASPVVEEGVVRGNKLLHRFHRTPFS